MFAKRLTDIILSIVGFIFLFPLFLLIGVLIRIKMGKPIFFTQLRVGRGGKLFLLYKFRTMINGQDGSTLSIKGEKRITPLGSFLRKYKLDELPELWNILKGDMSFVGPRPDVPGYYDKLEGEDRKILQLRPGLTGPASLKYINEEELLAEVSDPKWYNDNVIFPDKVRINRLYMENWSFWLDLRIIYHTLIRKTFNEENYFKKI